MIHNQSCYIKTAFDVWGWGWGWGGRWGWRWLDATDSDFHFANDRHQEQKTNCHQKGCTGCSSASGVRRLQAAMGSLAQSMEALEPDPSNPQCPHLQQQLGRLVTIQNLQA